MDNTWNNFDKKDFIDIFEINESISILELFHGPTAAFKDFGLQLAAAFFNKTLQKQKKTAIVFGATSGDTGAAAIDALKGKKNLNVFVLHPNNRISPVQRRLMTIHEEKNVFNIAIEGNFDDCQNLVKAMFNDEKFSSSINMSGVNSINWARIVAQAVYYFYAYFQSEYVKEKLYAEPINSVSYTHLTLPTKRIV